MLRFEDLPKVNSERWLSLEDFEGEEWRDVIGAEGSYMVSNYGRVKAVERVRSNHYSTKVWKERIRRLSYNEKGYLMCSMTINCKRFCYGSIARLVAMAFIPNPKNKPQVDHISTNKEDNRTCNLRWATNKENAYNPITAKRVHEINSRVGVHHKSEATKKILSEIKLGEKNPMYGKRGDNHPRARAIVQLTLNGEFVREWSCAREAIPFFGGHITACCRGKRNMAGGYKWLYKEDYYK